MFINDGDAQMRPNHDLQSRLQQKAAFLHLPSLQRILSIWDKGKHICHCRAGYFRSLQSCCQGFGSIFAAPPNSILLSGPDVLTLRHGIH